LTLNDNRNRNMARAAILGGYADFGKNRFDFYLRVGAAAFWAGFAGGLAAQPWAQRDLSGSGAAGVE
jgi:hypothetical protein